MPKRKKTTSGSSNNNPLSSARKDVGGLWHRKSGAGYHLFLSYYGSQPTGVVSIETSEGSSNHSAADVTHSGVIKAVGNSRAAKKRRRKKNSGNLAAAAAVATTTSPPNTELLTTHQDDVDTSHPLIQAFNSQSNKYSHMKNFIHTLSRPLPLTLRLRKHECANSSQLAKHIQQEEFSNLISPVTYDSTSQIYQSTPGSNLCKFNLGHISPELKAIVVDASMDGTLARQELGSMLPVLSLEAVGAMKKGSKVLDMCASPGSKTLQAVEVVVNTMGKKLGRVIANDVHPGRLDSLREAVLRSGVPKGLTDRILYTNYDASNFPPPKSGKLFDAIICDVPCSGDGTIRKDPHILPIWSPSTAHSLHGLQLKILLRALELIKVGGTVCYSTCSLNPIEDEAVVSAALREMNKDRKSYELLEWPHDLLPGFKRRPGVENWKVAFYDENRLENEYDDFGSLSFYSTYDDAVVAGVEGEASKSFWPHSTNQDHSLHRCTRLLPDDHDTGGFFLVLIKRI
ncbi:hypothetical protein ACHAWC_003057 [Mediolabrus comicus]